MDSLFWYKAVKPGIIDIKGSWSKLEMPHLDEQVLEKKFLKVKKGAPSSHPQRI